MKIAALLTGRGNNTLKDKNVLPVLGCPLCQYPAMAAKKSSLITDFYVSSDDEKILTAAEEIGYKRIVRPAELSLPTSQHIDAIKHALKMMHEDRCEPDILVVILANNAITKTEWIDESIQNLIDNPELSSSCPVMLEQDHHPFRCKCLREDGCLGTWFDFKEQQVSTNRQDLPMNFVFCHNFWTLNLKNTIYSKSVGQQPWTFMGNNCKPVIVKESFDVHDEEDIIRTEKWLTKEGIKYDNLLS